MTTSLLSKDYGFDELSAWKIWLSKGGTLRGWVRFMRLLFGLENFSGPWMDHTMHEYNTGTILSASNASYADGSINIEQEMKAGSVIVGKDVYGTALETTYENPKVKGMDMYGYGTTMISGNLVSGIRCDRCRWPEDGFIVLGDDSKFEWRYRNTAASATENITIVVRSIDPDGNKHLG